MSGGLYESYLPQWLYISEFMDALGQADESEKQDAVLLLIRDRMVFDGKIDEKHFRFLTGKPSIIDALWLANLSHDDVDWENSNIRAPSGDVLTDRWFLIEIASSALSLFGSRISAKKPRRASRTPPEQARALKSIIAIYGRIPPQDEVSNPVLEQAVNKDLKLKNLEPVKKDAIQRAAGRRR